MAFYFGEQGVGPILCGTTGKEAEIEGGRKRGGDREAVGDLSLQIGTTETFPNRMWLWFLTSFHSQLSDRFLLRWHLLHNDAQKCGTAQKWGSCCPTCQPVSVTPSPPPLSCDSQRWQQQLQQQNLRHSRANDALHIVDASRDGFLTSACFVCLSVSPWAVVTHLPLMCQRIGFTCADMLMHSYGVQYRSTARPSLEKRLNS